ncbi:nitroreductase family protein [Amycolatopsis vancoresmycina]|uniref:Oxidoreductase n=1 Tax=Amycolatopsis vancoresmycina DSM 44592 TaxID=1292037 RepID=R1FZB8_9PSEU|nr:nitroreductase family protein [Amycolatopsis vancoresmycina]EOD64693.1 oxidoreductase [Amycolatopsis vancoresmycina DSM 44592]
MDAETVLTTTRSVRRKLDLDREVPQDVLDDCLRIAQQAPAAGSMAAQFRWLLVRDAETKARIAAYNRETAEAAWAKYGHLVEERALASARHLVRNLDRVPVLAIPCMIGRPPADTFSQSAYFGSAYPAVWSFQLALRDRGLGSSICGYHLQDHETDVAALLGIPADVTQVSLLAVAYTTQRDFRPAARPAVEEITYFDSWDSARPRG